MLFGACIAAPNAPCAQNDDNVQWSGVFSTPQDRNPVYPGAGETFTVELRAFRGDITAARVRVWDGAERFHDMAWNRNEGAYDVWRATVGGTNAGYLYYYFEITDGADRDYYNALGMWSDAPTQGDFLINTTPLGRFPLGATPDGQHAIFRVWAPHATAVSVAGTLNNWSTTAHPLVNVQGFWQTRVLNVPHGAEYRYVLENGETLWRTDPYARAQTSSVGNSRVWKSSYEWGDTEWITPYFEDMVIYELHVGSFSGEGDGVASYPGTYRDAADRHLDHLVDLGINVVGLMPVGEFAGDQSWGYNPSFIFAPESSYGSPDDLKYLVDQCHRRGIAVILDVVYNHLGATDLAQNLLDYDGEEIYFYPPGNGYRDTPWGPRPDYGRVEVRNYLRDNVRYWLEEFHFDGFRLDGTAFVKVNEEGWRLLADIVRAVDTVSPKAIVTAEQLPNDPALTRPIAEGGAGIDSQWSDSFHDNLRQAIRDAAFGDPDMQAVAAGVNHFELGSGTQVVNYIESHDEASVQGRVSVAADGANPASEWAYGRSKVAAALVLFSSGIPMLLQGQEFLEDRPFGDAREHRIQWRYCQEHADFLLFMKDAVRLRRTQPALRSSAWQNVYHVNDSGNVLAFQRWTDAGKDLVIVVSLANGDFANYELGFPQGGEWFEFLNGDAAAYGGRNVGNAGRINAGGPPMHGFAQSASIVVPRMGVLVFAREPLVPDLPGFIRGDCNGDDTVDIADAIRSLSRLFAGATGDDCPAACDANRDDKEDIADAIYVLAYLFARAAPPPSPWPDCAAHATVLACERRCE